MSMRVPAFRTLRIFLIAILLTAAVSARAQYPDGIFAEFNTSMGSYTCRLDYVIAPKAVANFIGLATGERAWLDPVDGLVKKTPFYVGTTFHRVIAGFMNQGGSLNGMGTDGPGYQFVDEFNAGALHDGFGVLSMANSGPDSNGSQFFITVSPQPHLNGVHTVFGRLFGGSNVVYAINNVATGSGDKPLTNVVLQSVQIRRIGAAAEAFDIHNQGLPVVTNLPLGIARTNGDLALTFSRQLNVEDFLYSSTNLQQWTGTSRGIVPAFASPGTTLVNSSLPALFLRGVRTEYPDELFVPRNLVGRIITFSFTNETLLVAFDGPTSGIYTAGGPVGGVVFNWIQSAYRGRLKPIAFTGHAPRDLHLDFDSPTNGTFKGTIYPNEGLPVATSGTFVVNQ